MKVIILLLSGILILFSNTSSAEFYYSLPIKSLKILNGSVPIRDAPAGHDFRNWRKAEALRPYVNLDTKAEGYIYCSSESSNYLMSAGCAVDETLVIRSEEAGDIQGDLFLINRSSDGLVKLKFELNAPQSTPAAKVDFAKARSVYLDHLINKGVPGSAWFRYLRNAENKGSSLAPIPGMRDFGRGRFGDPFDDSFSLFSGGRAISENLQLDRVLPVRSTPTNPEVELSTISGITVQPFDWKPLIKESTPQLDSLSALIPNDHYVIFFRALRH